MNSNLIDSTKLHPDLKVHQWSYDGKTEYTHTREDFVESVKHWKNILGEQGNVQLGHKVGSGIKILNLRYASLLYAISELGGINLVLDRSAGSNQPPRCRVLAPFDLFIVNDVENQIDPSAVELINQYSLKKLRADIWFDYASTQSHKFAEQTVPSGDDLFMLTTSSGSTGTPKIIGYTHQWLSRLGEYCAQVLNYQSTDRVLHLTSLHHGGSAGVFFFPTMQHCQHHYFDYALNATEAKQKEIAKTIAEKRINKVVFPNSLSLDRVLSYMPAIDHDCCFYSLQANHRSWIQESRRTGIKIISIFGASETLGPIFINTIDPNTPDSHSVLNYGKPLPGFYSVEITNQQLQVSDITGKVNMLSDKFAVDHNGEYHYQSRSDLIRVNEVTLQFADLHNIVLKHFDDLSAALLADTTANKIYLLLASHLNSDSTTAEKIAAVDADLKTINPILKIDHVDFVEMTTLLAGIKLDRAAAINHFRKKFNLV